MAGAGDSGLSSSEEEELFSPAPAPSSLLSNFDRDRHVNYMLMMYQLLPYHYQAQEINRLTLAYFIISGLDILGALYMVDKDAVAKWVLSFQARAGDNTQVDDGCSMKSNAIQGLKYLEQFKEGNYTMSCFVDAGQFFGFHGSRSLQFSSDNDGVLIHNHSHLASSYSALAILKIVGYRLSNIDSELILTSMRKLQLPDGSFLPIHIGAETDLRFVYCAAAICSLLEDWSGMDKEKAKDYIVKCQSYDGGFGMTPGSESHGGGTYCAVASLQLMGFIEDDLLSKSLTSPIIDVPLLLEWCLQRQAGDGGFQGRSNKPSDTCYAFWVGAVLRILGGNKFIDGKALRGFLLTCQFKYGGFSKFPGELPDIYHSYYGYTAFSLLEEPGLNTPCVQLGITDAAAALGI